MSCNYEPELSGDDWDALGDNERRCKNCETYREEKGYGDFICRHIKGYREAPAHVRRCDNCNKWKKEEGIKGDFWCKHNKYQKEKWDRCYGWEGAAERAQEIKEWRDAM